MCKDLPAVAHVTALAVVGVQRHNIVTFVEMGLHLFITFFQSHISSKSYAW